jgi:hypothetical protein
MEWNSSAPDSGMEGSALRLVDRTESFYFLFGCKIKVKQSNSVPCLVQELDQKKYDKFNMTH